MALSHSFLMHFQCGFGDEIVPLHPLLTIPLDFHLVAIKVRFDFTPVPFTQKKPYTKLIELNGFENIVKSIEADPYRPFQIDPRKTHRKTSFAWSL